MSRAEIEAKKRYGISRGDDIEETSGVDMQRASDFIEGYHQAEKDYLQKLDYILSKINVDSHTDEELEDLYDCLCEIVKCNSVGYIPKKKLELTWEDIASILDTTDIIANDDSMEERLKTMSEEEYCQEVLRRFKSYKEGKEK